MKMNFTYIFLAFILVFLITISISQSCVRLMPANETNNYMFPYEAMTPMGVTLGSSPAPSSVISSMMGGNTIDSTTAANLLQNIMSKMTPSSNTNGAEGFTTNSTSDYGSSSDKIDIFSGTPGSLDCGPNSSNLTNSMGGLCLTKTQTNLLKTRGGNATGGESQIGN